MKGASHIAPFGLRMPEELKDKLQELAKKNGRSLNSEIVRILEEYLAPPSIDDLPEIKPEDLNTPEKMAEAVQALGGKMAEIQRAFEKVFPELQDNKSKLISKHKV